MCLCVCVNYLLHKDVLPNSEEHHVSLVASAIRCEEILVGGGGDLDGVGDHACCFLLCDGRDVSTWYCQL